MIVVGVTGVGGGVGQSIVRALRMSSHYRVIGFDMNPWAAGLSLSHKGYVIPSVESPLYMDYLYTLLQKEKISVLIPGSDHELIVLSKHRRQLKERGVYVLVGGLSSVTLCRHKLLGGRFFREYNLPFVRTESINQAVIFAGEVGYPLVIKPAQGSASRGVRVVFSDEELQPFLNQKDLIVQEYIAPKQWGLARSALTPYDVFKRGTLRQEEEISVQLVYDHEGSFLGHFMSKNILIDGVPCFVDPIENSQVLQAARKMAELLVVRGHIGPCNFQCRITNDGPKFFEVNQRFTGITSMRAQMGFNEVIAVVSRVAENKPIDEVKKNLLFPQNVICSRYVTEQVYTRAELKKRIQTYQESHALSINEFITSQ